MLPFVAICAVLAIAVYWMSRSVKPRGDFRDWTKNIAYREAAEKAMAAEREQLEDITVPDDISDAEITAIVERLLEVDEDRIAKKKLELLRERAVPALVAALNDPRFHRGKKTEVWYERIPLEKILDLLEPYGPDEAISPLVPFIKHEDSLYRKTAAAALGSIGTEGCIEPLTAALTDADDYVRSYAMSGIQTGIKNLHCKPKFLDAMFDRLIPLLDRSDSTVSGNAPIALLAINRAKALPILLGDHYCRVENKELQYILKAMNNAQIQIPIAKLHQLITDLKPKASEYPFYYSYGEALISLARSGDPSAESTTREALQSVNEHIAEVAARALGICHGIKDPYGFVVDRMAEVGFDRLTSPQRTYYAVSVLDAEVNNGGFAQYFVNSSGNHGKEALDGLAAIGAGQRHAIVQKAYALLGPNGPSSDRDLRARQLAALTAQEDKALDSLNDAYYKSTDQVAVKLLLFVIDNKEHFCNAANARA